MSWIDIQDRRPPHGTLVLLWGSKLEPGLDHPLSGFLCECGDPEEPHWVLDLYANIIHADEGLEPEAYNSRMIGRVTHWLDWEPVPGAEDGTRRLLDRERQP